MTERQGAFTVSTRLLLTAEQRARLERVVLEQRMDLADLVSTIVADHCDALPDVISPHPPSVATVPTRLYLTPAARQQIEHFTQAHDVGLADLVSQIVAGYLDTLPDGPPAPAPARDDTPDLRQRRAELNRLRARRVAAGATTPAWLGSYIAELEAEVRRLEGL